jgi:transaldolase
MMRLFLDSANLNDIREIADNDIVSGITTNPSLLAKEPKAAFFDYIHAINRIVKGRIPVSVEVFASAPLEMIAQAQELKKVMPAGLVVKIPIGWAELGVIGQLVRMGIPVNCTAIFTTGQAVMALAAGAEYVSFFYRRMQDRGAAPPALQTIRNTRQIYNSEPDRVDTAEIICGSIRATDDVIDCFLAGADIVTCSLPILKKMCEHPGTTESVAKFMADSKGWQVGAGA